MCKYNTLYNVINSDFSMTDLKICIYSSIFKFLQKYFLLCFKTPKIWQSNICLAFPISLQAEYIDFTIIASQIYFTHCWSANLTDQARYSIV